jgi:serine phosphatase RsbU (regulator of sigma subunit)
MQKHIIFFISLFINLSSLSQVNIDSIWSIWSNKTQADTIRLRAMHELVHKGYLFSEPEIAFYFGKLQYDFAQSVNNKKWMADALNTQGISLKIRGDYAKAIVYYNKSLKISEDLKDKNGIAICLGNIAVVFNEQGNVKEALSYNKKTLKVFEELEYQGGIASTLNNIGIIYKKQFNYVESIFYLKKSLKIKEEIGDKKGIANSLINIGNIYNNQDKSAEAFTYYKNSLKIYKVIEDKSGIGNSLENIGNIYFKYKNFKKAFIYYESSLKIRKEIGEKKGVAISLFKIGEVFEIQGNNTKAISYFKEALVIFENISALYYVNDTREYLYSIYKEIGKYKQAMQMHEFFKESNDSLQNMSANNELRKMAYIHNYEIEKDSLDRIHSELQIKQVAKEKELNLKIKNDILVQNLLIVGILIVLSSLFFINKNLRKTKSQKLTIEEQHTELDTAHKDLNTAHKDLNIAHEDLTSSITYAKRIQAALMPTDLAVKDFFKESFILYLPKDIVAGDFYWLEKTKDTILFAVADCTGHGVPGAMVSVICKNGLNRSVREHNITQPSKILDKTRELVIQEFAKSNDDIQDGMDIALCSINEGKLSYAGANNPLVLIRNKEVIKIQADRQPIGTYIRPEDFTNHTLDIQKDDMIYIFTDGFVDQFGGEKGKKYRLKNLLTLLTNISTKELSDQHNILKQEFTSWKGKEEQIDDVCVMGVRV